MKAIATLLASSAVVAAQQSPTTSWTDARELSLEGKAFVRTKAPFDRLPASAEKQVRKPVWTLSRDSAGMCVRFVTNAPSLTVRWTLTHKPLAMRHMPATGVSGVDLYVRTESRWRWLAVGRPTRFPENTARLFDGLPKKRREYLLYLPLYNGVSDVQIGVPTGSRVLPSNEMRGRKPVVFYGTSITQGACASRPGMCHTAILGRRLSVPIVNLGFSGNGRMEVEIAKLLAAIDAAAYVIDCLPNMSGKLVTERLKPFVTTLRNARPHVPIVLVEDRTYPSGFLIARLRERNRANRTALAEGHAQLVASGVQGLHYLKGDRLLGSDGDDTVDGSHPNDLGFFRHAGAFEQLLRKVLVVPVDDAALAALVKLLRGSATREQATAMFSFAKRADAPAAIPRLLRLLRAEAPRLDNNICLTLEQILREHPGAACDTGPLIEAIERKIWNSQQKAAQALWHVIGNVSSTPAEVERFARALIPLTTSQRSRVFRAGTRCLQKLTGAKHGPDPKLWLQWFEERFSKKLDLTESVYEVVAVVTREKTKDGTRYTVNGENAGDLDGLRKHLTKLRADVASRGVKLNGVLQIPDAEMQALAKTMNMDSVAGVLREFAKLGLGATISPASDEFRAPWKHALGR